jgi:hypothetical protein
VSCSFGERCEAAVHFHVTAAAELGDVVEPVVERVTVDVVAVRCWRVTPLACAEHGDKLTCTPLPWVCHAVSSQQRRHNQRRRLRLAPQ